MPDIAITVFDLLDDLDRLRDPHEIERRMSAVLKQCGYGAFLITTVPNRLMGHRPIFMINGWPEGWSNYYLEQDCYSFDPVAGYCRVAQDPFDWTAVPKTFMNGKRSRMVMNVAADFGMKYGRAIPVIRSGGQVGAVTMAGDTRVDDLRVMRAVHILGLYAYGKIFDVENPEQIETADELSKGEQEVLTWIAAGKSTWDISAILRISENTVEWRLKQAFRKLNAVSRTQAVVTAIRRAKSPSDIFCGMSPTISRRRHDKRRDAD